MHIYREYIVGERKVIVVGTAARGGGKWQNPVHLNVVDLPLEAEFQRVNQPGAKLYWREYVDARHSGPRSNYAGKVGEVSEIGRCYAFALERGIDPDMDEWSEQDWVDFYADEE